jgi:hypothetical protein
LENGVFIPEKPLSHTKGRQKALFSIEEPNKDENKHNEKKVSGVSCNFRERFLLISIIRKN